MSILPISKDTIIYGSADGGKTVHADNPQFNLIVTTLFFSYATFIILHLSLDISIKISVTYLQDTVQSPFTTYSQQFLLHIS
jgi:hypothetical protein